MIERFAAGYDNNYYDYNHYFVIIAYNYALLYYRYSFYCKNQEPHETNEYVDDCLSSGGVTPSVTFRCFTRYEHLSSYMYSFPNNEL